MKVGKEVGAVLQALNVLRALAQSREPLGVTQVARASGVNPSTALNILRTLVGQHMVAFIEGSKTYQLDYGLLELARSLLNKSQIELLIPDLQSLTTRFEATATLWQIGTDRLLLLGRVVPDTGIHIEFPVATRNPVYVGAMGRMVAATRKPPMKQLETAFNRIRWNVPINFKQYVSEVEAAAKRGFAIDLAIAVRGVTSVGSVITDRAGEPRLAIAFHTFLEQVAPAELNRLGEELKLLCARAKNALF